MKNITLLVLLSLFGTSMYGQLSYDLDSLITRRFIDSTGREVVVIKVPGKPPDSFRMPEIDAPLTATTLSDVPGYDWSFGCSATSAAMMAGYYDRTGYSNMYTGPTNGGVAPMDNSSWGSVVINGETRKQCPISATRNGVDGRITRGHVDDYWVVYGSSSPDPYITNGWTQHAYEDCTGDYMYTNQSALGNTDGSTTFYYYLNGSPYTGTGSDSDGLYGLKQFFQSRGYTVVNFYNQYIYGYNGNTIGFTFTQYKQQIDAGRPVLIQVSGHSMVGYGYDDVGSTVYLHDTWDYSIHSMSWGGSYSGMQHYGVGIIQINCSLPGAAGTISGISTVCQGQSGVSYGIGAITNATGYTWTVPTGATITAGANTNIITVSYSASASSGDVSVYGSNSCGNGTASAAFGVTVNQLPSAAGTIAGTATVCQGQSAVSYSVPTITNATGYTWAYSGTGATITGTTENITISFSSTATSGNITVFGSNSCGNGSVSANYAITVNPLPSSAGTITGTSTVCQGQSGISYTVPEIANATSYNWVYSGTGATITGTTNSVTIAFSSTATAGNLTVLGTNSCGSGTISANFAIDVSSLPSPAGLITGTSTVCQGQSAVSYSVPVITNATGYTWAYSGTGATITGTTENISISFSSTATSGNLTVFGSNSCGNGTVSANYSITLNPLPSSAGTITGTSTVCQGQSGISYTVPEIANATSYNWVYSGTGATITGTTNSVTIAFSSTATAGYLTVLGTNSCGSGTISANFSIDVSSLPSPAGLITGTSTVCQGQSAVSYSVPTITNATGYTWAYSGTGATITGTTENISISFSSTATSGNLTVFGSNSCGNGSVSANYSITLNPLPSSAGTITGPSTVCQEQTGVVYSVPSITNATGYTWTLPAGVIIVSGSSTNTIIVDFTDSAVSGIISVLGTNSCGNGAPSPDLNVTVNPIPLSPVITANGTTLSSSAPSGNQWYLNGTAISGATDQTYEVTESGDYYVVVTLNGCSSQPSNTINVVMTGINHLGGTTFNVYPVPNDGRFTVTFSGMTVESLTLEVYNYLGVRIYDIRVQPIQGNTEQSIDLRPMPNGVYTVVLRTADNRIIRRILVNK